MVSVPLIPKPRIKMVSPWSWNRSTIALLGFVCTIFLLLIYHKTIGLCLFEYVRIIWRRILTVVDLHGMPPEMCRHDGLCSVVLERLPAIQFRKADIECGRVDGDCPICLGEYMEGDWLRMLPKCSHVFHSSCIDAWFHSHSNCPLCRTVIGLGSDCRRNHPLSTMLGALMREGGAHGDGRGSAYHVHVSISVQGSPSSMVLLRAARDMPSPAEHSESMTISSNDQHLSGQTEVTDQELGSSSVGDACDQESMGTTDRSELDSQPKVVVGGDPEAK